MAEDAPSSHSPDPENTPVEQVLAAHLHGRPAPDVALDPDEQQLVDDLLPWLNALRDAAEQNLPGDDTQASEPIREDDPVALMLGLVPDPDIVVDGRKLATARKRAGLDLDQLHARLHKRGWEIELHELLQWELGHVALAPAILNAIADELAVKDTDLLSAATTRNDPPDLFDDARISAYLDDWAAEAGIDRNTLQRRVSSTLAGAVHRNKTHGSAATLLAVLRTLRSIPDFLEKP